MTLLSTGLEAHNLWKIYRTEGGEVAALKDVSLAIPAGQFATIIGRSGSGKSTLMGIIGGLSRPSNGTVRIGDIDLWSLSANQRAELRNRSIGIIFQFASLLPTLRAVDNVALPRLLRTEKNPTAAYERAELLLTQVGLSDRRDAYPNQLSGGEQRRVAIARALINAPPLLLADEPTGDLDQETEAEIMTLLLHLCRSTGTTLVMVTHRLSLTRSADQVLTLQAGKLEATQPQIEDDRLAAALMPFQPMEKLPIPSPVSLPPSAEASKPIIPLGSGLGRRQLLWFLPVLPALWAIDLGVAAYQRQGVADRRRVLAQLDQAAHGYLYIDVQTVESEPDGLSYRVTMVMQNLNSDHPLYIQISPMRAFVQSGFIWREVPARFPTGEATRIVKLISQATFQAILTPDVEKPTELIPGYMHVRLDTDLLISQRSQPEADIVNRRDPYYIYLKPQNADDQAILRQSHYPGKPPLYMPMPPH
ncbi:hypothetical protein DO97_07430 [Neosynechococcus sphagnicola sy1]|uniref:ABC transporter domain-containing protein n=1 Tax=Neosynechococcus sphagnicola sy1 TaxID=1497020 RepID=A0A098TJX1_9CYAN|nr:ABC transporter ATP-binding protein [Neosynechococcus sphagnicola]KGF72604.1 hypothetical protein DO97_07430 [Neosynechococcus sphagnicola sy1]